MKNIKTALLLVSSAIAFTSCKDENQERAQKSLDHYTKYVDSISHITKAKAVENWAIIENDYAKLKTETENALATASDKLKLKTNFENSVSQYEEFKTNILTEKEKMDANKSKNAIYQSLFGANYVSDDMQFNWVNKDNIVKVYENFISTIQKNKDSYSREDWDEIKLVYEALDSRKNTVEKEGLSSSDNTKIAGLKLKFAPMYTLNRMSAKSEENTDAKK